jgi:hypothetical protein
MSVLLTYKDGSIKNYVLSLPIETQLVDVKCVFIKWNVDDEKIVIFLADLLKAMKLKVIEPFELCIDKVDCSITKAKMAQKVRGIEKNIALTWLAKEVVNFHNYIDKSLEDLSVHIKTSLER